MLILYPGLVYPLQETTVDPPPGVVPDRGYDNPDRDLPTVFWGGAASIGRHVQHRLACMAAKQLTGRLWPGQDCASRAPVDVSHVHHFFWFDDLLHPAIKTFLLSGLPVHLFRCWTPVHLYQGAVGGFDDRLIHHHPGLFIYPKSFAL